MIATEGEGGEGGKGEEGEKVDLMICLAGELNSGLQRERQKH